MSVDDVAWILGENSEVMESYILIREMKLLLEVGHDSYHPELRIKVYKDSVEPDTPFHVELSHHVQTPGLAAPQTPGRSFHGTEREAIRQAVSATARPLREAIQAGHTPERSWLVVNSAF